MSHNIKHDRSQALIDFAYRFAKEAHGEQKRKYTFDSYIVHPVAVAGLVSSVTNDCEMICAALLHDTVEDTDITLDDIKNAGFGFSIAKLVDDLTDISNLQDGNRAVRKNIDLIHTSLASDRAKTIKLADLIDNSKSILAHDKKFAVIYMNEMSRLLVALIGGDKKLYEIASKIVINYYKK